MKKLLKVCMILLTCCMANVFVCGTTNDISIVCAKDYGIEHPKYRKGNTIWDTIYFGYYYQSQYDDKKEPIRWKVLSVNGDNAFIITEECLDCQPYNKVYEDVTWETCSLRKWLNEDFYNEVFTSLEQEAIISTNVINNDSILVEDKKYAVSNNFEKRINDNYMNCIDDICRGLVNDEKARKINQFAVQLHGHAGMFSTVGDMTKLVENIMQGRLINNQWIDRMGMNCTGSKKQDGTFTQFHGYLSYSKNPIEENSEVSHWLSGEAFALGGYTGNQLTIDRRNEVFLFMASNRCHNRVTRINSTEIVYDEGYVVWTDGKRYIQNQRYAYDRDAYIVRPALELALQYRYLELLLEQDRIDIACSINEIFR